MMNEDFVQVAWLGAHRMGDGCMWSPADQLKIVSKGRSNESW